MLKPLTRHVTAVFRTATDTQLEAGINWYDEAHAEAGNMADKYNTSIEVASGVIAALSPLNSWGNNISLAHKFLRKGGLDSGYLTSGLNKAKLILNGDDIYTTLNSPKTQNFFLCIASAGRGDGICIDRHAFDIAVNVRHTDSTRPSIRGKRYDQVAHAYKQAAKILSLEVGDITASQTQAVAWVTWRNRYWAEGAFDGRD
jgi:hypothetical protein